jgi:uncharacterized damage-inducible protein DinB
MANASPYDELQREWQDLLVSLPPERVNTPHWFQMGESARPFSPVALFAELEEVRDAVSELRASERLEKYADRFVTTAWTLKDLLAHLAAWAGEFRREVEIASRGARFDYAIPYALSVVGPTQWNQIEVEKRAPQSLGALLQEFDQETRRLQELALELPEETLAAETDFPLAPSGDPTSLWKGNSAQIILMKCTHDRYHIGRIQQWLATVETREPS